MNPSLLLIPDRYKASKLYSQIPDSGAGDLAFTRANDTATRVNSAGLIEKVRTNIALFSEQFDNGFWNKIGTSFTVTANTTTAPNGTLTADTLNVSNNDNVLYASRSGLLLAGNEYTFSIYMKGTGSFSMSIRLNSVTTTTETKTLTSEWQRFSVSVTNSVPVLSVEFYLGLNTLSTYNVWGAQVESGPVATGYIATPTSSDVSVGPVANIPRIDYTGGGCGKLLLEPQRTNLIVQSERLNTTWTDFGTGTSVTPNVAIAPDGTLSADLVNFAFQPSGQQQVLAQNLTLTAGVPHTISFYAKAVSGTIANLVVRINGGEVPLGQTITTEWQRFTKTITPSNASDDSGFKNRPDVSGNGAAIAVYLWGVQIEAGSYPTSYIPTLGASVTRSADSASKTGISSLIGQTEGTMFIEFFYNEENKIPSGNDKSVMRVESGGGYSNEICILYYGNEGGGFGKTIQAVVNNGGVAQASLSTPQTMVTGYVKVAFAYKANDFALAVNGVVVATDNSGSVPTCANFSLNESTRIQSDINPKQAALYPTRLSNAELTALTTL